MFTIKHVSDEGRETMIECHGFVRERLPDGFYQYTAHHEGSPEKFDHVASWCGDEGGESLRTEAIYVMNRYGATVATHRFNRPNYSVQERAKAA